MKNRWWKRLLAMGSSAALTALSLLAVSAAPAPIAAPEQKNPYSGIARIGTAGEPIAGGHQPGAIDPSYYRFQEGQAPRTRAMLPSRFDLREQGLSTVVKNQYPWGNCI